MDELTSEAYRIKLPVFEGPLDLLLSLIKKNKIDIYDIPIAFITAQYLQELEVIKELNLDIAGDFLVLAATLVYIKSRMLLPVEEQDAVEEEDPRLELVQRLIEYQSFKEAAFSLREIEEKWDAVFIKEPLTGYNESECYTHAGDGDELIGQEATSEPAEPVLANLNIYDLFEAFKKIFETKHPKTVYIAKDTLTIDDKIAIIIRRLEDGGGRQIGFNDLFTDEVTRLHVIVTFLALLEMLKGGYIYIYQKIDFGEIWIKKRHQT
ncbi:segregation and condensation protein A [Candidatus Magnetobacterium bavaricum]|uniref:Segregation and condensation protein A n=1 Tax=Candidatus Magnetobacterium bavaricum TaxID=29290 RepID=A0A0F3GND3_9BACT|nr:segregation and condensation protein A [Candidatus Magnetobacterium bavaricum]